MNLGHSFSSEFQLDNLDILRRVDLNIVLSFSELALQRRSKSIHVVRFSMDQNEMRWHDLSL